MSISKKPRDNKCGYCNEMYTASGLPRHIKNQHTGEPLTCSICPKPLAARGYCVKHYSHIKKWGKIVKTIYDNEPTYYDDRIEYIVRGKTVIFDKDFTPPKGVPSITSHGYVTFNQNGKRVYGHRLAVNAPKGLQVDHINHNTLDNRRSNLRIVTPAQNMLNRPISVVNKSGYLGVYFDKQSGKWTAQVQKNRKKYTLPYFDDIREAVAARDKLARQVHGEFANLNLVES